MLFAGMAFSQVARNMTILEIGTGTGCGFCPGAAMGAHDLLANGCHVAVIEYHNYNSSDPFNNTYAAARCAYYGISGYPTAVFDGTAQVVGGSPTTSMYADYLPVYTTQHAIPSPLEIYITGTHTGNNYTITLILMKVSAITATNLKAHLVLTESYIPYNWQNQTEINDTERLMAPDAGGTSINFNSSNIVVLTLNFTKDASWIAGNCTLISFVQDDATKAILNGAKVNLNALPTPLPTNFTADVTTGCTPMTVHFSDNSTGATSWNWTFPGGTPATSTLQNPTVVYNTTGVYDVTLVASSATSIGAMSKAGYITVNALAAAPAMPAGITGFCMDPPNQTYTISPVSGADSYTWELTPTAAGTLTNNGTSCTVDFSNTYVGEAQLKVCAVNICGNSPWSPALTLHLSVVPGLAATPTGPTAFCMDPGFNDYYTTGAANAVSYTWELTPAYAGTLYPGGLNASVAWNSAFSGAAAVKVKGTSYGCDGTWSTPLDINVIAAPTAYNVTGGGPYCAIGGTGSPVGLDGSQTGTNYTLYIDGTSAATIAGNGNPVSFGNQMAAASYSVGGVTTTGNCMAYMAGTVAVTIDPALPAVPGAPAGPATVHSGNNPTSDYTTTAATYANTYSWELTPAEAGTMSGTTTTGTANWNLAYTGPATVHVAGVNSCGAGSFSVDFPVAVYAGGVGMSENENDALIGMYPNPASGSVTIIPARNMKADLKVFNSLGAEVITRTNLDLRSNYLLDISTLKSGIYFIRVSSGDLRQTLKLVVR